MIVIVTGGRDYPDRARLFAALDLIHARTPIVRLMHGACGGQWPRPQVADMTGADRWGHEWATERAVEITAFAARWKLHGKRAGPIRNGDLIAYAGQLTAYDERRVLVLAAPGGAGTADMVRQAKASGLTVKTLDDVVPLDGYVPPETQTEALASDWWRR